ncbi:type VI secretion system-associated FHA domain protein TagH [Chelativorans salis]|uniref:Type VI secretion system-associated FHA domain protein TagH n=1 Tax=Chelativorans salis TaxID=2978478 RepID=A0ABT2LIL1_9HYPH|nr:type VI secretion system-associated FHA domain protein TagH [Chelativorans sp. EGI FJ00035]MCT7374154.1 type VI secretion system-associated FHA domain protein TagH [Chelativorans sp. EGI FJ00035]
MHISLRIDNVDRLPGGGPLSFQAQERSFEIGRESRDWRLPDPNRFISGRHCEVRFENSAFWLHDVSRNGTFINGSSRRLETPHRLADGDRVRIGPYIISVSLSEGRRERVLAPGEGARWSQSGSPARPSDPFFGGQASQRRFPGNSRPTTHPPPEESGIEGAAPLTPNASGHHDTADVFLHIAVAAGVRPEIFTMRDQREVAAEIGAILRNTIDELAVMLKARASAKVLTRSGHQTMVGPADNNPLKSVPGSEDILEIMFTRNRTGYLDAKRSVEEAFNDLETHEYATYAAMQQALFRLLEDLSPEAIERKVPAAVFASRKARAWDAFVATWKAREDAHENGMLDVFLAYFAEAYAKAVKQK